MSEALIVIMLLTIAPLTVCWHFANQCKFVPASTNNLHLMTVSEENSAFCFPRISMFPKTKSRERLRFEGNKIHCSPRDQPLSDLLCSKTKQKKILKNTLRFQQKHQATSGHVKQRSTFRSNSELFPISDVIVFAMLPTHGIWRETVPLLDVM